MGVHDSVFTKTGYKRKIKSVESQCVIKLRERAFEHVVSAGQKMIEKRGFKFNEKVIQHKPLGFFDYNKLQQNAFCVVSDSGTVPEEGAFFGFPAVSIRTSTERPEAMDKGVFTIGSITSEQVLQAVDLAVNMWQDGNQGLTVPAYSDENVSTKVVKIIQSYTGIINKMVWRKI